MCHGEIAHADAMRDRRVERDEQRLDDDGAEEAAGQSARRLAEAVQHAVSCCSRAPTHSGWSRRSGRSSRSSPSGARTAGAETAAAINEPAPQHPRGHRTPHGIPRRRPRSRPPRRRGRARAARCRDRSGRRSRPAFESALSFAVSVIRTTSPPMLLGRKLLKNVATRNDCVKRRAGTGDALGVEQQPPAPRAGQHHQQVEAERAGQPQRSRPSGRSATAAAHRSE